MQRINRELTHLSFVSKKHCWLGKVASKELRQECEVNDWREGDEVNVGSHVDETEARVVDRVAGGLSHASSHRLNDVEHHQEGHVIVKRPLLRHHN